MTKKSDAPAIRFKGFSDAWEQRKAKELFVSTADKGYPELPVLSATQDRGMIRRDENSINIFHDKKNEVGYKRVLPGQFVIHLRSFQGGFAHSAIEGITSPAYTVFGFSEPEKHDSEYWKYVFTSKSFIQRLETVTYGIRDGRSISYEEFLTLGFVYPSKAEQTAIARYLDKLSDLITLHQRKFEKLTNVKKSMLEKMFPQNGSSYPEIRFKGFTDPWEQRKLSDLIIEYKETVDSDCTLPVLTSSKTEGVVLQEEHFGRVQNHDITGYNILPRNYCTYRNRSDGVDFTFNINRCCDKGIISKFYPVFYGNNSDIFFISMVLNYCDEVVREIAYTCTGTGQKVLSFLDLQKMNIRVPSYDEQKKISQYFEQLDNLITLHQRELEKLQNIKKSMLEKMFV